MNAHAASYADRSSCRAATRVLAGARKLAFIFCLCALAAVCSPASSAIIRVSPSGNDANTGADWTHAKKTLQGAINAAAGGDEIWAAAATYQETITLKSNVALYGGFLGIVSETTRAQRNWTANETTIDANLAGIAVTVPLGAVAGTAVDGFTIRNGKAANGAGVYCKGATITLANNKIRNNAVTSAGGGLYCESATATLTSNTFISNSASSNGGGVFIIGTTATVTGNTFTSNTGSSGAGMFSQNCAPNLSNNTFTTNTASSDGGGYYSYNGSPTVSSNTFTGNVSTNGSGGGVYCYLLTPVLTGNSFTGNSSGQNGAGLLLNSTTANVSGGVFSQNTAGGSGGAVAVYAGSPALSRLTCSSNRAGNAAGIYCNSSAATIINSTFRGGTATDSGGGITIEGGNGSLAANNTIADNFASNGGGGIYCLNVTLATLKNNIIAFNASGLRVTGTAPVAANNCVFGNDANAYQGIANQTGLNGNIAADPQLANFLAGDLHIQPASPCRNTGDNGVVQAGWLDMDWQARIQPGGGTVDIGADESDGTVWPGPPASKVVYVSPAGSDANTGLSWPQAKLTVQAGIDTAVASDQVWVAAGTYVEMITLKKRVGVYGGFAIGNANFTDRNPTVNLTAIDANLLGTVVKVPVGAFASTTIEGFTIRNGKADATTNNNGGGLYCAVASIPITNIIFRNNGAARGGGVYLDWSASTFTSGAFRNNTASNNGGGLYCSNASPTLTGTLFTSNNSASNGGGIYSYKCAPAIATCTFTTNNGSSGGGYFAEQSPATVTNSTFTSNTSSSDGSGIYWYGGAASIMGTTLTGNTTTNGNGAGIYLYNCSGVVSGNTLTSNSTTSGVGGGICVVYGTPVLANNTLTSNSAKNAAGLYSSTSSAQIINSTFRGNIATDKGGGITLTAVTNAICANNTLVDNFASNGGAGIHCLTNTSATLSNNILAFNASGLRVDGTAPVFRNNCVFGNDAFPYQGIPNQTGLNGNIAADPLIANLIGGNLHIQPGSPCLNAGDNNIVLPGWTDMDGELRVQPAVGGVVDIGADESDGTVWPGPAATKIIRVKTTGNDGNAGASWTLPKKTIGAALAAALPDDEIWVASGTYVERITLKKRVGVYGGFQGIVSETLRSQRNVVTNITTINANLTGPAVIVPVGAFASTTIDGFTIRNGQADASTGNNGGGIYCVIASIPIANNTFRNNQGTIGAGVYCDWSASVFTGNSFRSNIASQAGGGVYCADASPTFTGNLFTGNTAPNGAGAYCVANDPSFANNTFSANTAAATGGGLYTVNSSAAITSNTFTDNSANDAGGVYVQSGLPAVSGNTVTGNIARTGNGGGVYLYGGAGKTLNNAFANNSAAGSGGGIYGYSSAAVISVNTFANNRAFTGAGMFVYANAPSIYNNTLNANIATDKGGGIVLQSVSSALCLNNTIADNFAANGGGGIYCWSITSAVVDNNIVAFNASGIRVDGNAPVLKNNCVYGNDNNAYIGVADPTGTNGNIAVDPLIANVNGGNLHIQPLSPCRDTGNDDAVAPVLTDMDGQDRIQGVSVDIGADETDGTSWPGPAASKIIYVKPGGNDANSGLTWALAKKTVQAGIDTAVADDQVWVAAGTYVENIVLKKRIGLYGGFTGSGSARNPATNVTVLDGGLAGTVVTVAPGAFASTAIDGFTIQRGVAGAGTSNYGGGIYCQAASVLVANDIITGNSASYGAGLFFDYSSSIVTTSTIRGNNAVTGGGGLYLSNSLFANLAANFYSQNRAQSGAGLQFYNSSSDISGSVITGNAATSQGGGFYCQNGAPTLESNVFSSNSAPGGGGGVYMTGSSAVMTDNTLAGNTALNGSGGGISLNSGSGSLLNGTISGNTANASTGGGGGLYCNGANWTISGNVISDNRTSLGGGIYVYAASPKLINNNVWRNTATAKGGGIYVQSSGALTINNTIVNNTTGGVAGAAHFESPSGATFTNNIVAFNGSGVFQNAGTLTLKNNDLFSNTAYNYSGMANPIGANGNISADPKLANALAGNLHIQPTSLCVDAGNDDAVLTILYDIDGEDRIQSLRVDIGADESDGTGWPASAVDLGAVKRTTADNTAVVVSGLSVTGVFPLEGYVYVEKLDRSCGIRVNTFNFYSEGELLDIMGTIRTDAVTGERYIEPDLSWPKATGGFVLLRPMGGRGFFVGGDALGLQPGITGGRGTNNVGLLLTVWGRVKAIDSATTPAWFQIDDGSAGLVKVQMPSGVSAPVALNDYVSLPAVVSLEKVGANRLRLVRARRAEDIIRQAP